MAADARAGEAPWELSEEPDISGAPELREMFPACACACARAAGRGGEASENGMRSLSCVATKGSLARSSTAEGRRSGSRSRHLVRKAHRSAEAPGGKGGWCRLAAMWRMVLYCRPQASGWAHTRTYLCPRDVGLHRHPFSCHAPALPDNSPQRRACFELLVQGSATGDYAHECQAATDVSANM